VICDALEMKAASATLGIPEAAALAVIAGVDLICLGRDTDEAMYHAVRAALADAVASGRLAGARLEEAANRVAELRSWLATARVAWDAGEVTRSSSAADDGIGLLAARRALRRSGPVPSSLADPLVIEIEPEENIAAGRFTWGFGPWADVRRVDTAVGDGEVAGAIAAASGRPLMVAVQGVLRALPLVSDLLGARPDAIVVEMGVPVWKPPPGTAYLASYGASRASAQAVAEALGLVT
jgi:beta-N-acetylhexosaminidase